MIKTLFNLILLSLALVHHAAISDESDVPDALLEEVEIKTLRPFFNALKSGNVTQVERYLSGEIHTEARGRLKNKGYPDYLREYYQGAVFSIQRAVLVDNEIVVDYVIDFPDGGRLGSQLYLQEQRTSNDNQGQAATERHWSIRKQPYIGER